MCAFQAGFVRGGEARIFHKLPHRRKDQDRKRPDKARQSIEETERANLAFTEAHIFTRCVVKRAAHCGLPHHTTPCYVVSWAAHSLQRGFQRMCQSLRTGPQAHSHSCQHTDVHTASAKTTLHLSAHGHQSQCQDEYAPAGGHRETVSQQTYSAKPLLLSHTHTRVRCTSFQPLSRGASYSQDTSFIRLQAGCGLNRNSLF